MFRVVASHEAAVALRNALAAYTDGRIWTNRYPHTDQFHIELDQFAAAQLVQALTESTTTREGNAIVKTPSTAQDETEAATANEEQLALLAAVVAGLKRLK